MTDYDRENERKAIETNKAAKFAATGSIGAAISNLYSAMREIDRMVGTQRRAFDSVHYALGLIVKMLKTILEGL